MKISEIQDHMQIKKQIMLKRISFPTARHSIKYDGPSSNQFLTLITTSNEATSRFRKN